MYTKISDEEIVGALARTGFALEHRVAEEFRRHKWGVISGRYYIDDHDGGARELDVVAYRIHTVGEIDVVSTVLVSCKKEAENTWAFLSRPAPKADANLDWCPVHWWTDEEPLATFLQSCKHTWKVKFEEEAQKKQPTFHRATRDIFAYQVISPPGKQQAVRRPGATPNPVKPAMAQNNLPIFSAVSGLLKALHYELSALPQRMAKKKRVYVFHLAIVADAPMVDVRYEKDSFSVERVDNILHLARFIVAREPLAALVYFSDASNLPGFVNRYEGLSHFDAATIQGLLPKTYTAIEYSEDVRDYFSKLLESKITQAANKELREVGSSDRASTISFRIGKRKELIIEFDLEPESIKIIGSDDSDTMATVARLLREHMHYSGVCRLDWDIPF